MSFASRSLVVCLVLLSVAAQQLRADDWPQWRGPQRDGVWRETGIRDAIPADGLPAKWRVPVGLGYAGPAVADGRVYLFDYEHTGGKITNNPGGRDQLTGRERLLCLDAATGRELWRHSYERPYNLSYPGGPRCTPTVDGDRVYLLGAEGNLKCLRTADGAPVWARDFAAEFGAETPVWGHSAHPLVVGDLVITMVGGRGQTVMAFNKHTGEEAWRALTSYAAGYCPPSLLERGGVAQVIVYHPDGVASLDPATGKEYWSVELKPSYAMSIAAPQVSGDRLFATGMGGVSMLLELADNPPRAEILWRGNPKISVACANSTPFMTDEAIYGCDSERSTLIAVNPSDGERLWETKAPTIGEGVRGRHGTAFIVRQGDRYWLFSETGDLVLARLSPARYEEVGRMKLVEPTSDAFGRPVVWSHPAFANQSVYARNDKELVCVSLAE
jgi:outer membrane protein assembly factor BamB